MSGPEQATAVEPPRHWEADVVLRDGKTAHVRPIRPEDAELLVEFYERVSDRSKYYRFFSPMPHLSDRDVARFTQVDHDQRVAFVMTLQGQIIAVGRYDVVAPGEAEVAFLVEDQHQGRGIAQILLEHLAQAARERGVERFVAEVLPDNQRMIQTFRDAGYRVVSAYDEGVLQLEFPIEPTDTAIGIMQGREHVAEAASIHRFFNPTSVAVIGASRRQDTIGQALVRNLVTGDFTGRVYAVNPSARAVSGLPTYKSVTDIQDDVDVAIVAVPAESVEDVVLDCAAKGVHGLVVISSGFAETGEEGRQRQRRLVGLSRSYGVRLIGPNALGIINTDPAVSINASLAGLMPPRGRAGFFCQSGALGSAILEKVRNRGLGLSTFVSAGNRADVSGNDLLQYWEEDESTEVVMMYLESIGNPRKFSRIARRVSLRKPIIAVRSGRTTQGVPMGHAVRKIAAPPQAVDAMFRQAGVIQVDTLEDMFDVAQLAAHQPLPRGRRVAIVGNSDALGLLAADAASAVGLVVNKQVALSAEPSPEDFEDALDDAIDDPDVDAVVVVYIPPLSVAGEPIANVLAAVGEQSDKPLVSTFLGTEGIPRAAPRPRRRRLHRGPRLGAVLPRGRGGGPRAGAGGRVRRLAAHPGRRGAGPRRGRPRHGPAGDRPGARREPGRCRPRGRRAHRAARGVRDRAVGGAARLDAARGPEGRPGAGLERRSSRPPPSGSASGRTWRTCGATSTRPRRCATPGRTCSRSSATPRRPATSSRRTRRPAYRSRSGASRTRSSGRSSRSASPGRSSSCSPTCPTGSRRSSSTTRRRWCARSAPRRCCSATAAARWSTSTRWSG